MAYRLESKREATRDLAQTPHKFGYIKHQESSKDNHTIIVPRVSSENRIYVPMGLAYENEVVSDSAMVIYDAPIWLLGVFVLSYAHGLAASCWW